MCAPLPIFYARGNLLQQFVHIRNLEKYHPGYKDRNLIWCKVYFNMINADPEFEMLEEIDKWRFIAFIMLELQYKNPVPIDNEYLQRKGFNLKKRSIKLSLNMLHNFVDIVTEDNKSPLQFCNTDKRREDKRREDKIPPTKEDVEKYIKENNYPINANKWYDHYKAKDWYIGKNKMKDWKAAVRTWLPDKKKEEKWFD